MQENQRENAREQTGNIEPSSNHAKFANPNPLHLTQDTPKETQRLGRVGGGGGAREREPAVSAVRAERKCGR